MMADIAHIADTADIADIADTVDIADIADVVMTPSLLLHGSLQVLEGP